MQTVISTPLGPITATCENERLVSLEFGRGGSRARSGSGGHFGLDLERQLEAYFAKELKTFSIPLAIEGTPFQQKIWAELLKIPYGETISYAELARRVGHPDAYRAAGTANGKNRFPILIPCHRVIAADGTLGGYSAGLHRKRKLLELENG